VTGAVEVGRAGSRRYDVIVGTGGIGSGISLRLEGNHLLGREESRPVSLLDARDYCKLHIVFHYLRVLVGDRAHVLPVGKVGDDAAGSQLLGEMQQIGLDLGHVTVASNRDTLYSVAFSYPNGEGGNLTTIRSASHDVTPADIRTTQAELVPLFGRGMVVALPEVSMATRLELLRMGGELSFLRVATFVSSEATAVLSSGILADIDLLVLNADEAAAFTGTDERSGADVARHSIERLLALNDRLSIVITAGVSGSWSWNGATTEHVPAILVPVRNTAGAGDAHLAGILSGLTLGASLHEANRFASLISSMKVGSPHTINAEISWSTVRRAAVAIGFPLPAGSAWRRTGDQ